MNKNEFLKSLNGRKLKYSVRFMSSFKRDLREFLKTNGDLKTLSSVIEKLANKIPLEEKYRDHALKGEWRGFRECHIKPDLLLIYIYDDGELYLTLVRLDSHGNLF